MHSINKALVTAAILLAGLALLVPPLIQGSERDLKTTFSINHPFVVPGLTLEPNTKYVIMVGDAETGMRQLVRVYNEDESKMLAMFLALWDERRDPVDKTTFEFYEVPAGHPQAIDSWFYPGRKNGMQFVYPKDQAQEIANASRAPVLGTTASVNQDTKDLENIEVTKVEPVTEPSTTASAPPEPAVTEPVERAEKETEPAVSEPPANEPVAIAQNEQKTDTQIERNKPEPQTTPATTTQAEENRQAATEPAALPRTAGELPLIGLIGTLCLSLGLGIRLFSSR